MDYLALKRTIWRPFLVRLTLALKSPSVKLQGVERQVPAGTLLDPSSMSILVSNVVRVASAPLIFDIDSLKIRFRLGCEPAGAREDHIPNGS